MVSRSVSTLSNRSLVALLGVTMAFPFLILSTACSDRNIERPEADSIHTGPTVAAPREGVYLRASFDDDPSMYIGRFIADGVEGDDIDENRSVRTSCTDHITYREVRAAGQYDEYYKSSTNVQASLGVDAAVTAAPSGEASVGHQRGTEVRVSYELNRRIIADIEDYDAFTECCETSINGCSGVYIGEFWAGTGTVFQNTGQSTDVNASGSGGPEIADVAYQAGGEFEVADGWVWRRGMTFDDVYFAFRVFDTEIGGCGWVDRPPRSDEGHYFVGISPPAATQDVARTHAMRNARTQVVQYLGEAIAAESVSASSLDGYLGDETVVATAAEGIASRVRDDRYCPPEVIETPEGPRYISRVLAFIPNEQIEGASREIVKSVADQTGDESLTE